MNPVGNTSSSSTTLCPIKDPRFLLKCTPEAQPTSPKEPFPHRVRHVERQPLSSAPCGQVLASNVALLGDVLIWPEDLSDRGRCECRARVLTPQFQCRRTEEETRRNKTHSLPIQIRLSWSTPGSAQGLLLTLLQLGGSYVRPGIEPRLAWVGNCLPAV